MDYVFSIMQVGEKIAMPPGKWSDPQREMMELATAFCNTQDPRWQFQSYGHEGSTFEPGQYWLERIR